jgi:anti-sigma factor RsiW
VTADGHLGDLLSGLVDGQLDPAATASARAHLDGCPRCRAELAATEGARRLVRALPPVEPPFGFYPRLLSRRGALRRGLAGLAAGAAAAAAAVTLATAPRPATVRTRVPDLVQTHAATASVAGDPVSQLVPAALTEPL